MGTLNLTAVTPDTPYIKKIKAALEKGTGDKIPIVEVKKVQRKGGVSTSPIFFRFAGGQELVLYVRASADVFKSELNGKEIVLPGDFSDDYQQTFDNAVSGIAKLIREAQPKVEQQNQKEKVKLPPRKNRSIQQQISDKREEETQLDQDLSSLTAQRDQLLEQLKQAQAQKEGGEATQGKQIAEGKSSAFDSVDWDEEQHPRDEKGKFSVKSSSNKIFGRNMDAGAGSGAMGRFALLQGESSGGQQAYEDALKLTGLPVDIDVVDNPDLPKTVPMRYDLENHRIEVNIQFAFNRPEMAQYMAEELLHATDHLGNRYTLSAGSEYLYFGYGKIMLEVQQHDIDRGFFAEFLDYPLNPIHDLTQDRIKAELFARLGVLYFAHPEVLKRELPQTYEVYHELFGISQSSPHDGTYVRSKIWATSRGIGALGGNDRTNSEVRQHDEKSTGRQQANSELGQLLSAIAIAFKSPITGQKAKL